MITGLNQSGKTAFICAVLKLGDQAQRKLAAMKPFDNGLLKRNATETPGDGSLICRYMTGEPMEILVSPYVSNEDYPIEMSFRRDGIQINWGFLNERVALLSNLHDRTLIEVSGGLCGALTEDKTVSDWLEELKYPVLWVINADASSFEQNLSEIRHLKELGLETELVINNTAPITDQDLLFYMWEKIERLADQEIAGMIPFVRNLEYDYDRLAEKTASALPDLLDRLLS